MGNIYDFADTWNDGATTFAAIKVDVTDTASNASSLLMDLQVGSTSKFAVGANGRVFIKGANSASAIIESTTSFRTGAISIGADIQCGPGVGAGSAASFSSGMGLNGICTVSDNFIGFTSGSLAQTLDTLLYRDAAGSLALRNSTNAQAFNIYNTYSDASNYERGYLKWLSGVFEIGTEPLGTGTKNTTRLAARAETGEYGPVVELGFYNNGESSPSRRLSFRNVGGLTVEWGIDAGFLGSFGVDGFNTTGLLGFATNSGNAQVCGFGRSDAGVTRVVANNLTTGGSLEFLEQTAPSAGGATSARIFAEDDGAGKTRLMIQFGTGAAQQLAIEP